MPLTAKTASYILAVDKDTYVETRHCQLEQILFVIFLLDIFLSKYFKARYFFATSSVY